MAYSKNVAPGVYIDLVVAVIQAAATDYRRKPGEYEPEIRTFFHESPWINVLNNIDSKSNINGPKIFYELQKEVRAKEAKKRKAAVSIVTAQG